MPLVRATFGHPNQRATSEGAEIGPNSLEGGGLFIWIVDDNNGNATSKTPFMLWIRVVLPPAEDVTVTCKPYFGGLG